MRGKRAKALRALAYGPGAPELAEPAKVKVGRRHGGPAFARFPYPKSTRYVKRGKFNVMDLDEQTMDKIRETAAKHGVSEDNVKNIMEVMANGNSPELD